MSMCKRISVRNTRRAEHIHGRLARDISAAALSSDGVRVRADAAGEVTEIRLHLDRPLSVQEELDVLHRVANIISDAIVNDCEPELIEDILDRHYHFLEDEERQRVLLSISGEMSPGDDMTRRKIRRKSFILRRLYEYLRDNDRLSVEGFVAFRLKEYVESLEYRVEEAVSDVLILREYTEWTELLRHLSLPQLDSPQRVHVQVQVDGDWTLWDDDDPTAEIDLPGDFPEWEQDLDVDYPDELMAALIMVRPREVVVHDPTESGRSRGVIPVLREIFDDRLHVCEGCEVCQ